MDPMGLESFKSSKNHPPLVGPNGKHQYHLCRHITSSPKSCAADNLLRKEPILTICSIREVLSQVILVSSFFCFSILIAVTAR